MRVFFTILFAFSLFYSAQSQYGQVHYEISTAYARAIALTGKATKRVAELHISPSTTEFRARQKQSGTNKSQTETSLHMEVHINNKRPFNQMHILSEHLVYEHRGEEDLCVMELKPSEWHFVDTVAERLGYECYLAHAFIFGREWNVWYAPKLSVSSGPWRLGGLPGLIVEATSADGEVRFIATEIQLKDKPTTEFSTLEGYRIIDYETMLSEEYKSMEEAENRMKAIMAKHGMTPSSFKSAYDHYDKNLCSRPETP